MLLSTQDLLADSREQAGAVSSYIDALKEFWTAQARLEATLGLRFGGQHVRHEQQEEQEQHHQQRQNHQEHQEHAE
jgi:Sec-independent protein translocase protein TatA